MWPAYSQRCKSTMKSILDLLCVNLKVGTKQKLIEYFQLPDLLMNRVSAHMITGLQYIRKYFGFFNHSKALESCCNIPVFCFHDVLRSDDGELICWSWFIASACWHISGLSIMFLLLCHSFFLTFFPDTRVAKERGRNLWEALVSYFNSFYNLINA